MKDRSAALVDVMSFLFLFAIVVFVTSTDGAQYPPATPQRFFSVNVSVVTPNADEFRLACSELGAAEADTDRTISLAVYLRLPGNSFFPADVVAKECYPGQATNTDTAHLRILLEDGAVPDSVLLFVSEIGRAEWLGDTFSLDLEVYGNDFCARQSHDLAIGSIPPLVVRGGDSGCT